MTLCALVIGRGVKDGIDLRCFGDVSWDGYWSFPDLHFASTDGLVIIAGRAEDKELEDRNNNKGLSENSHIEIKFCFQELSYN
jgi:hypothetical protein